MLSQQRRGVGVESRRCRRGFDDQSPYRLHHFTPLSARHERFEENGNCVSSIAATVLSVAILSSQPAAWAYEAVPAAQVTQMARALPKPVIDKGKVWTTFVGGAVVLFLTTLALENNSALFPAIAKANSAASEAKRRMEDADKRMKEEETEYQEINRQTSIIDEGLKEAKARREAKERLELPLDPAQNSSEQRLQNFVDQVESSKR